MENTNNLIKTIVLKTTLDCNLRCAYCYEFDRNEHDALNKKNLTVMKIKSILYKYATMFPNSKILWMLHGGEPLIMSYESLKEIFDTIREINLSEKVLFKFALQTNGTLLNDKLIELFIDNIDLFSERVISLSIDGPKSINDQSRLTMNKESSFDIVLNNIKKLKKHDIDISTISVIGTHNLNEVESMYNFITELNPNFSKFIPCYNFDNYGKAERLGINPIEYANFMCKIFDLWMKDSVNFTDDNWHLIDPIPTIISSITKSPITWCEYRAEKCNNFMTVFPNGDLWLCDTFNHSAHKETAHLGNIFDISDEKLVDIMKEPTKECNYNVFYESMKKKCKICEINEYCNGGCIAQRNFLLQCSPKLFKEYCNGKKIIINHIKKVVDYALLER